MGFSSYCMSLSLYIMSSCLRRYSVFNLILQMHAGQRSMCGLIVVDASGVSLLVSDVMPIYMIIPRYSHNYAQFCQLLNSNLFTHVEYLFSREKPLVKPMAPGSIFIISISYYLVIYFAIYFAFILLCIFIIKIPKILSYHIYQISLS